jgi:hypothetical protein
MGVGRVLRPSVWDFHGLVLGAAAGLVTVPWPRRPKPMIEFIGASDTAGYCVDGTPNTSSIGQTLGGWEYSNCDRAYPGVLGDVREDNIDVDAPTPVSW